MAALTARHIWPLLLVTCSAGLCAPSGRGTGGYATVITLPRQGSFFETPAKWTAQGVTTAAEDGLARIISTGDFGCASLDLTGLVRSGSVRVTLDVAKADGPWALKVNREGGAVDALTLAYDTTATGHFVYEFDAELLLPLKVLQLRIFAVGQGREVWLRALKVENRVYAPGEPRQAIIPRIAQLPNLPQPFKLRDWRQVASDYDAFVFDLAAKGPYLPLTWIDKTHRNFDEDAFGQYTVLGDAVQGPGKAVEWHESINTVAAVIGATLCGIDKSRQGGRDWVSPCKAYFCRASGENVIGDTPVSAGNVDGWYVIYPNVLFYQLASLYPREPQFADIQRSVADRFDAAVRIIAKQPQGFHIDSFDFKRMEPIVGKRLTEPDLAAGFAWVLHMAYLRFGDARYLQSAEIAMKSLVTEDRNPYIECLLPFGACLSARMNAELGRDYDTGKLLNWCFSGSDCRETWGGVVGRWGGYDVGGLVGNRDRAYLMNIFDQAAALAPIARYDTRFAHALGKWLLNAANATRLFYAGELPDADQSDAEDKGIARDLVAYEALSPNRNGRPIYADRDDWGPDTREPKVQQFSLYGSSHVGYFGALIGHTSDERILAIDLLTTDFYHAKAYPTYLVYNPYSEAREVEMSIGATKADLYDAVAKRFVARNARGKAKLRLEADTAAVIVVAPTGGKMTREGRKRLVDGVVIDYGG